MGNLEQSSKVLDERRWFSFFSVDQNIEIQFRSRFYVICMHALVQTDFHCNRGDGGFDVVVSRHQW